MRNTAPSAVPHCGNPPRPPTPAVRSPRRSASVSLSSYAHPGSAADSASLPYWPVRRYPFPRRKYHWHRPSGAPKGAAHKYRDPPAARSRTSIPPVVSPLMPSFTISQPVSCAHSLVHRWDGRTPYPKVRLSPMQISFISFHSRIFPNMPPLVLCFRIVTHFI